MSSGIRSQTLAILSFLLLLSAIGCSSNSSNGTNGTPSVSTAATAIISGPTSLSVGVCSSQFTVQTTDSSGNPTINGLTTPASVTITPGGHGTVYSDSACSTTTSTLPLSSTGSASFYVSDTTVETLSIGAVAPTPSASITASDSVPVVGGSVAAISVQGQEVESTNTCNAITVNVVDTSGNKTTASSAISLSLSLSGLSNVVLYSNSNCSSSINSLTIASGSQGTTFYIESASAGNEQVIIASTSLGTLTLPVSFQIAPADLIYVYQGSTISGLNFGVVATGTSSSPTVTLENSSAGDTAMVSAIQLPLGFSWNVATTTCATNASFNLAPGQSCNLGITFAPTSAGSFSGNLVSTYEGQSSPLSTNTSTLSISATAVAATSYPPTLSLASINFNSVQVGSTSIQAMTLANPSSTQPVSVTGLNGLVAPFQLGSGTTCSTTYPFTLAASASCTIVIEFAPTAAGNFSGAISYSSNWGTSNTTAVSGTGISATPYTPYLSYSSINFSSVPLGYTSSEQMVLYNPNNAAVSITGVQGIGNGFYLVSGGTCSLSYPFTLAANSNCTLIVEFAPSAVTSYSGSVTYSSSAGSTNTTSLSGQGIQ